MEKMRILVAGCGSIGMRHLQCLLPRSAEADLAAFDVSPAAAQRVKAMGGAVRFHADLAEALGQRTDLAIVCTPNELHEEIAVAAIRAGAHVLCEKPIAHTVESGWRIVEAARGAGRVLAVGYTERFRPAFEFIAGKVRSGDLGSLVGGRAMVGTYNTLLSAKSDFRSRTFGALLVDYTHELDMLGSLFGEVKDVVCRANRIAVKAIPADPSLAAMLIEYRSGAIVSVHFDYVQHPQRRLMEIYGDRGTLEFDMQADTVKSFDCDRPGLELRQFESIRNERFVMEHQDVLDAIRKGTPPRVDGEQALKALAVAEGAIRQLRGLPMPPFPAA